MPQLMPLMWMGSVIMSMMILLMLIDMFFYKESYNLMSVNYVNDNNSMSYMW